MKHDQQIDVIQGNILRKYIELYGGLALGSRSFLTYQHAPII